MVCRLVLMWATAYMHGGSLGASVRGFLQYSTRGYRAIDVISQARFPRIARFQASGSPPIVCQYARIPGAPRASPPLVHRPKPLVPPVTDERRVELVGQALARMGAGRQEVDDRGEVRPHIERLGHEDGVQTRDPLAIAEKPVHEGLKDIAIVVGHARSGGWLRIRFQGQV